MALLFDIVDCAAAILTYTKQLSEKHDDPKYKTLAITAQISIQGLLQNIRDTVPKSSSAQRLRTAHILQQCATKRMHEVCADICNMIVMCIAYVALYEVETTVEEIHKKLQEPHIHITTDEKENFKKRMQESQAYLALVLEKKISS